MFRLFRPILIGLAILMSMPVLAGIPAPIPASAVLEMKDGAVSVDARFVAAHSQRADLCIRFTGDTRPVCVASGNTALIRVCRRCLRPGTPP